MLYMEKSRWHLSNSERTVSNAARLSGWSAAQGNGESLRMTGLHLVKQKRYVGGHIYIYIYIITVINGRVYIYIINVCV